MGWFGSYWNSPEWLEWSHFYLKFAPVALGAAGTLLGTVLLVSVGNRIDALRTEREALRAAHEASERERLAGEVATARAKVAELEALQPTDLTDEQGRLLEIVHKYLVQLKATKLVIGRGGILRFAEPGAERDLNINLAAELFAGGKDHTDAAGRFDSLMETFPPAYLRLLPETRFDNPFVVSLTQAGIAQVRERQRWVQ